LAGVAAVEESIGVLGPPATRGRRAAANAWSDYVDVPQADRSQRSERRCERLASSACIGNASGAGGVGVAEWATNFEAAIAWGHGRFAAGRRPPQGWQGRRAGGDGVFGHGADRR